MNLALFDFDGTITTEDTFTKFLFFATSKLRLVIGFCLTFPVIALYKLKLLPANRTRPVLTRVAFAFRRQQEVQKLAQRFVDEYLPTVVRAEMLDKITWHKAQGDDVYLVSASLDPYLSLWAEKYGMKLVCSTLQVKRGRYSGSYVYGDCSKQRKVTGIKRCTDPLSYSKVYAYGDTSEDLPMLSLAQIQYFKGQYIKGSDPTISSDSSKPRHTH